MVCFSEGSCLEYCGVMPELPFHSCGLKPHISDGVTKGRMGQSIRTRFPRGPNVILDVMRVMILNAVREYGAQFISLFENDRNDRHAVTFVTTQLLIVLCVNYPQTIAADIVGPAGIGKKSGAQLLARCEPALRLIEAGNDAGLSAAEHIDATSCIGFVDGFIWGHAWSAWRERADMFYCPPEQFSAREGVPALVNYLRAHPDRLIQRAHLLLFAAFNSAYPCQP